MKATQNQKSVMLEFLKKNPNLLSGKFTATFTHKHCIDLWKSLAEILNSIPGARKDWSKWRKCWHDMRSRTKVKASRNNQSRQKTGGGAEDEEAFTKIEEEILGIIKTVSIDGHPEVDESIVQFKFENDCPSNIVVTNSESTSTSTVPSITILNEEAAGSSPYSLQKSKEQPIWTGVKSALPTLNSAAALSTETTANIPEYSLGQRLLPKLSNAPEGGSTPFRRRIPKCAPTKYKSTAAATEMYQMALNKKNAIKEKYYAEKLEIMRQMLAAEQQKASALVECSRQLANISQYLEEL